MNLITIHDRYAENQHLLTNGYGVLEVSSCQVEEEINGNFSLQFSIPSSAKNADKVQEEAIVKVKIPRGYQCFRIIETTNNMGMLSAYCEHISYDLRNSIIGSLSKKSQSGKSALQSLLAAANGPIKFSGSSDITVLNDLMVVRSSILTAIMKDDLETSFLNCWGGELFRDNFIFNIVKQIGGNRGIVLSFAKDLTGFTRKKNYLNLATRIIPTYVLASGEIAGISGYAINSPRINDYAQIYEKTIHFSNIKVGEKNNDTGIIPFPTASEAEKEVRRLVALLWEDDIDLPEVSADISFISLAQTEEYKAFAPLETVELGDIITCLYNGQKLKNRVSAYVFDVCAQKCTALTIGKIPATLVDSVNASGSSLANLNSKINEIIHSDIGQLTKEDSNIFVNQQNGLVAHAEINQQNYKVSINSSRGLAVEKIQNGKDQELLGIDSQSGDICIPNYEKKWEQSLKENQSYQGITVSRQEGLSAQLSNHTPPCRLEVSAQKGFSLYEGTNFLGGIKELNLSPTLVSGALLNTIDQSSYLKSESFSLSETETISGLTLYHKNEANPDSPYETTTKIGAGKNNLELVAPDGTRLSIGQGQLILRDKNGTIKWQV